MPSVHACLLILFAGTCPAVAFPFPRLDVHGDPLPVGAVGRLGTSQLRALCNRLHFSPDGRALIGTESTRFVRIWDARTGSLMGVRPLPASPNGVRSADGRTLLISRGDSFDLIDVESARPINLHRPKWHGVPNRAMVSNDRRWILAAEAAGGGQGLGAGGFGAGGFGIAPQVEHLVLWNTSTGASRTLAEDEVGVVAIAFSSDGKRAVSSGGKRTRGWDVASGKKLWEVAKYNAEECRFTPDGKYVIAGPGGGQHEWHVWDAATGKPAAGLHPPDVGYAWTFAISPDGTRVLVPTDTDYVVWDMRAGRVTHRWPGANQSGRGVFAPDGRSVVTHDTILRRWDLATGKNLYADVAPLGHTAAVRRVFFTPDGKRLVSVGDDRTIRVWDVATTKPVRTIPLARMMDVWTLAPDGSALIGIDERLTVHRWSLADEAVETTVDLWDAQRLNIGLQPKEAHALPDGTLALLAWPRSPEYRLQRFSFSFWDLGTGKLVRWGGNPGNDYRGDYMRLSPDGRFAAGPEATFDTRTGAKQNVPSSPFGLGGMPLFSPDSRLLAATSRDTRVWELATGRVVNDLPIASIDHAAFSPDGRRLGVAAPDRIAVWDVGLRREVAAWPTGQVAEGHDPLGVQTVAFSPDGRLLATGQADGTILLWPVPAPVPDGRWSESEAVATWDALAEELPTNAYPALWQLTDYPAEAVRFLRRKVALTPEALPDEWAKLIAGLDSPRFAEREAASKRLRELGRAADGPLRQAIKQNPSPEQLARIEALLAAHEPAARPRGEDLRGVRAVAALEAIGTAEARKLLAELAERGSPPRLAEEAARAAERLRARPVHP